MLLAQNEVNIDIDLAKFVSLFWNAILEVVQNCTMLKFVPEVYFKYAVSIKSIISSPNHGSIYSKSFESYVCKELYLIIENYISYISSGFRN